MKFLLLNCCFLITSQTVLAQSRPMHVPIERKTASPLKNYNDSVQYAIGSYLAQWVNAKKIPISNSQLFLKGLDDVFRNLNKLIPDTISIKMVNEYQEVYQQQKSKLAANHLFEGLKGKTGIGLLPNGVYYKILKESDGPHPRKTDSVVLNIKGQTADGIVFEDTYLTQKQVTTHILDLIPGVSSVLPMMGTGAKWQIYIPAQLAYGNNANELVPAYSALVVDLELVSIKSQVKQ